jgi:hypothetical protein
MVIFAVVREALRCKPRGDRAVAKVAGHGNPPRQEQGISRFTPTPKCTVT